MWPKLDEHNLPRLQWMSILAVVLTLSLMLSGASVWLYISQYHSALTRLEDDFQRSQESILTSHTSSTIEYLQFMRAQTEILLRNALKEQVRQAMDTAKAIYQQPLDDDTKRKLIIEALRPVRFFSSRGYYFIDDMQGNCVLLPTAPQIEGKSLFDNRDDQGHYIMRGLIGAVSNSEKSGYSRYRWYTPDDPKNMAEKLSYVELFEPYDWIIGAGDYLYTWERDIKNQALRHLRALRFGKSGHFSVLDGQGNLLLSLVTNSDGVINYRGLDKPSFRESIQKILDLAQRGGGFLRYEWIHPGSQEISPKLALVTPIPEMGWILLASIHDDEFSTGLSSARKELEQGTYQQITALITITVVATLITLGLALLFSRRLGNIFAKYHANIERQTKELAESEAKYRIIIENSQDFIWTMNYRGQFTYVSPSCTSALGYSEQELISCYYDNIIHFEDLEKCRLALYRSLNEHCGVSGLEIRVRRKDGSWLWVTTSSTPVIDARSKTVNSLVGISRDITERHRIDERLRLAASVFDQAREGISITDAQGRIIDVNPTFCEITGYSREEIIGKTPSILKSGRQGPEFYRAMWQALEKQGFWRGEIWNRRKDGQVYPELLTISAVRDEQQVLHHYVGVFSDISLLKEQQQRLELMAHYDALTQLPNRVLLADRLQQAIAYTQRNNILLAVCYLDLDNFKPVNDNHGHETGDRLLVEVARRLKQTIRGGDTIARLGGDEFVLLLSGLHDVNECEINLNRLQMVLAEPYKIGDLQFNTTASIGVTLYPIDDADSDTLLRHADQAMYQAKQTGRSRHHIFDPEYDRQAYAHREAVDRIKHALLTNEFCLHYQPKVNMRTGEVLGAEALIRWQHPERGLLPPAAFLPTIEDTELAIHIGEWVIKEVLQQISLWQSLGMTISVSVNLSGQHLQQKGFVSRLRERLHQYPNLPVGCFELEVLESTALEDITLVSKVIEQARALGIRFALDDFGTGYSSLTYLKRLPAEVLKIDQSFVIGMIDDNEDRAIVQGVIGLAKAFRRTVIAEGIETAQHGYMLLQMGCDIGQGYGIARPMPATDFPAWVQNYLPDPLWSSLSLERRTLG